MRKITLSMLVTLLVLLYTAGASAEMIESRYAMIDRAEWDKYDLGTNRFDNVESFLAEMDAAVEQICYYVHMQIDYKITFKFVSTGSYAHLISPRVYLNIEDFQHDCVPYVYLLSNCIVQDQVGYSGLQGAFAYIMQDRYGKQPGEISNGFPIHSVAAIAADYLTLENTQQVASTDINIFELSYSEWINYFILTQSFIQYLIDQYGIEKFLAYYQHSIQETYQSVFGKSLEQLKDDWIKFLKKQEKVDLMDYMIGAKWQE